MGKDNSLHSRRAGTLKTESMESIKKQIIHNLVSLSVFNWILISTMEIIAGNSNH